MKKIILLILTVFASVYVFGQDTDSTYTTVKTESVSGFQGISECAHEWFTSSNEIEDSSQTFEDDKTGFRLMLNSYPPQDGGAVFSSKTLTQTIGTRQQVISRQCTECGKQISTITTWNTYLKNNEDED